jgi:hypothetical protein
MGLHCQEENNKISSCKIFYTTFNVALCDIKSDLPGCFGKKVKGPKAILYKRQGNQ